MADAIEPIDKVGKAGVSRVSSSVKAPWLAQRTQRQDETSRERAAATGERTATPSERVELGGKLQQTHVQFLFDEDAQLVQAKVIDDRTRQVIREIPSEALLELAASIRAYQKAAAEAPRTTGAGSSPVDGSRSQDNG